eukprot:NODE_18149_length_176_cov_87.826772_g17534_i0.p1 GENE.NODE_18149_length_176_cov_87.826772_g17534_i0~~NODE_18149_length_176_cov_87.826772_g17534_i0.p1  ORF type:complete len:53 (-),score=25.70 NODE_18149_length_176_cov_87.826772_g17534_i0:18-146(-)
MGGGCRYPLPKHIFDHSPDLVQKEAWTNVDAFGETIVDESAL